jgi:hypothetical protein
MQYRQCSRVQKRLYYLIFFLKQSHSILWRYPEVILKKAVWIPSKSRFLKINTENISSMDIIRRL